MIPRTRRDKIQKTLPEEIERLRRGIDLHYRLTKLNRVLPEDEALELRNFLREMGLDPPNLSKLARDAKNMGPLVHELVRVQRQKVYQLKKQKKGLLPLLEKLFLQPKLAKRLVRRKYFPSKSRKK